MSIIANTGISSCNYKSVKNEFSTRVETQKLIFGAECWFSAHGILTFGMKEVNLSQVGTFYHSL